VLSPDAFLTELYVLIDDWDKDQPPPAPRPGPAAHLSRSEVLTLALFSQWAGFASERAFWRYAELRLRPLFPRLPSRVQFNRAVRRWHDRVCQLGIWLGQQLGTAQPSYEILDATGIPTRDRKRRGRGWLAGDATLGQCTRLGWYMGVRLLLCVTPNGAVTGFGLAHANTDDRPLAETFLALRAKPNPQVPGIGQDRHGCYLADGGFTGKEWEVHWRAAYRAEVVCPPQTNHARSWLPHQRRWLAKRRQIIETVTDRLLNSFRLARERPHHLRGLQARLAAKVALHNACIWFNTGRCRPPLAFADLIDW
jgi:hypothetical protein